MQRMSRRKAERIERVRAGAHGGLDRERPGARGFRLQPLVEERADEAGRGHARDRRECASPVDGEQREHERIPEHPVPEAADAAKETAMAAYLREPRDENLDLHSVAPTARTSQVPRTNVQGAESARTNVQG